MKAVFFIMFPICTLFCADATFAESDFTERTINFLIFSLIVWYLSSNKIKSFFLERRLQISQAFETLQQREIEARKEIERKEKLLVDAQNKAKEIVSNAKKEAFVIAQQFDARLEQDIKNLAFSFDELLQQESKNMLRDEVERVVDSSLDEVDISQKMCMEILVRGLKNG